MSRPERNGLGNSLVGELGERPLLALLEAFVPRKGSGVEVGIGDDCAVVEAPPCGARELLTTDLLVEGTHFLRAPDTNWRRLGRKAVAVNLSDVAAMGGRPRHILVSLGLPADIPVDCVLQLYGGMRDRAARYGAQLVGGDTVRSRELLINIALTGWLPPGCGPALRSAAVAGQHVYVSGDLGRSKAGLELLTSPAASTHRKAPWAAELLERHLDPEPRIELGSALAALVPGAAMVDVSDGLFNELGLLADASGAGFRIEAAKLPVSPALRDYCRVTEGEPVEYALFSGEEYELLFACAMGEEELSAALRAAGVAVPVTWIGRVAAEPGIVLLDAAGCPVQVADGTFRHFHGR